MWLQILIRALVAAYFFYSANKPHRYIALYQIKELA